MKEPSDNRTSVLGKSEGTVKEKVEGTAWEEWMNCLGRVDELPGKS